MSRNRESTPNPVPAFLSGEPSPEQLTYYIHLPGSFGFDQLDRLDRVPQASFATAHDERALQAFAFYALD
jgi:hypothetical protein